VAFVCVCVCVCVYVRLYSGTVSHDSQMTEQIEWSKSGVFMSNCATRVITTDGCNKKVNIRAGLEFYLLERIKCKNHF